MVNNYLLSMKFTTLRIALLVALSSILIPTFGQTVEIPAGNPAGGTTRKPLGVYFGYERSIMVYDKTEINAGAGIPSGSSINKLEYYLESASCPPGADYNCKIYLKEVAPGSLSSTTFANALVGAQLVYDGNLPTSNWTTFPAYVPITLQNCYIFFNNNNSIQVMVETNYALPPTSDPNGWFSDGTCGTANSILFRSSNTATANFITWQADNNPPTGSGSPTTIGRPNMRMTYAPAPNCTALPPMTPTASASSVCSGVNFSVTLPTLPCVAGLTFQWQYAPQSTGIWGNIGGATNTSLSISQSAATSYRCYITCTFSGSTITTNAVLVNQNNYLSCYCSSSAVFTGDTDIGNVTMTRTSNGALIINNPPGGCNPVLSNAAAVNTYSNFTGLGPYNLIQGENYGMSMCQITQGTFFFSAFFNVFIDWNADGAFDLANERVLSGGPTSTAAPIASGTVNIPYSSALATTRMRVQLREGGSSNDDACGTFGWGEVEDYNVTIVPGLTCNLTTPGNATSSFPSVCVNQQFTLNISGNNTVGSFQTWQWQVSTVGPAGPWNDIVGANYIPYKTTQTVSSWYRCILICNAGAPQATGVVSVPISLPTQCYCIPPHPAGCGGNYISNVVFNTLSNATGCTSGNANSYTQYPVSGATTTSVTQGSTYNVSVTTANGTAIISVWIDFNRDGDFNDAGEWYQPSTNNPIGATATMPINIPTTSGTGLTGMRIRTRSAGSPNGAGDACTAFFSGEAEDYFITILPFIPPACVGTPAAGYNVTSTQAAPCSGSSFTLTLQIPLFSGMSYQWQSSPTGLIWTNIPGANSITYTTTQTQTTYYRCTYSCSASPYVLSGNLIQTIIPNYWKGVNSDWSDIINWCSGIPRITDDVLISRTQPGVASPYFTPVVAVSDTVLAANLTISLNDSITLYNDTLNAVNIDSTLLINGKMMVKTSIADTCCTDISNGTSLLNTYQPFKFAKENRLQMVYIPQDFVSSPNLGPNDQVTYIMFKFESATPAVSNPYQNFAVSFGWVDPTVIAFSSADPFPTPYSAYTNSSFNLTGKALNDTIMIPMSNFKWRTDSNLVLQFCYNTPVGGATPGGIPPYQTKVRTSMGGRKTTLYLTSTNDVNNGCALLSSTLNTVSDFVEARPNIRLIFGRKPKKLNIPIRNLIVNSTGVFSSTISNINVATNVLNSGAINLDSTAMAITGNLTNSGTVDMNYVYGTANEISSLTVTGTVTNSGTINAAKSSMIFNGTSVSNTGTINAGTATHTLGNTAGTFDNAAGGTFNAEGSTLNINSANFNNSGTYVQGTGLAAFNSALTQTIGGTAPLTFYRMRLNKTANTNFVTLVNSAVTVTDSLQLLKGSINLNGQTLKFLNPAVLTMRPNATAGYIVSSLVAPTNFSSKLQWTIGTNTGLHVFPFLRYPLVTAEANNYIPVEFANVAGVADPVGDIIVATYPTSATNTPLPPNVWHINNGSGVNNSANMGNRFWYLERTTPIVTPGTGNTTLAFTMANNEKKATQTITGTGPVSNIRMQPYYTYTVASPPPLVRAAWLPGPGAQGTTTTALGAPFRTLVNTFTWPATVGSAGPWASGTSTTPLPIELLQFDATLNGTSSAPYVDIDWATASEQENDFFTIEKTIDFKTISEVDRVPSLGNSASIQKYHTVDNLPVMGKVNYYRLKQTDFNGTSTINDKWVAVKVGLNEVFTINYVKNQDKLDVIFEYDQDNSVNVVVTDLAGREMYRSAGFGATPGLNVLPINASGWADGAYIITLSDNERQVSHKIFY